MAAAVKLWAPLHRIGSMQASNVNPAEVARFEALANRWWDPDGESRPLHDLNPLRTAFVAERVALKGADVVWIESTTSNVGRTSSMWVAVAVCSANRWRAPVPR